MAEVKVRPESVFKRSGGFSTCVAVCEVFKERRVFSGSQGKTGQTGYFRIGNKWSIYALALQLVKHYLSASLTPTTLSPKLELEENI